jgi:putative transposase
LTAQLAKLQRPHRQLNKKQSDPETKQGSRNREKVKRKIARGYGKITDIRLDAQHKLTTAVAHTCSVLGVEDRNIKGMFKNRKLARAMADAALGQLLRLSARRMALGGWCW